MEQLSDLELEVISYCNGPPQIGNCCQNFLFSSAVHTNSAMVFGPNFKRKKGVQIGRRHKRGDSFRRAQELAARAQEQPPVPAVNSAAVDER